MALEAKWMAEVGAHHREGWAILSIVFSLGNCIFQVLYERKMCAAAHPERGEGRGQGGKAVMHWPGSNNPEC